jgi:uncharacterized membrane protein
MVMNYVATGNDGRHTVVIVDPERPVGHTSDITIGLAGSFVVAVIITLTFMYFYSRTRQTVKTKKNLVAAKKKSAHTSHKSTRHVKK